MAKNKTQGNPRDRLGNSKPQVARPKTITADLAKERAQKKGLGAKSGNPREKKVESKKRPSDLEGFSKANIGEIQQENKRQSRKLKKIQKLKRHSKEAREARKLTKKKILFSIAIVLVLLGIGTFIYLYNSDVFEITEVEYVGADHLTRAECEALAPSPEGSNLLNFDGDSIKTGFLRDAWVEGVSFNRVFPHKLQIVINEKDIGAIVEFNSGANQTAQNWVITLDGTWIMGLPDQQSDVGKSISQNIFTDAESAVHIKDCPNGISPEMGKQCTDETVLNALKILKEFSTDLKDNVSSITASNISATTLQLKNNVEIAFGAAENVREKERIAKEIMEQNSQVVYVNVRSVERPTWRSATTSSSSTSSSN